MERNELVMLVARNIEAAMTRKGTNAAEVARRAGLNPTAVYDILSGKSRSPKLDTLHKIAVKGLSVPVSALLAEPSDDELDQDLAEAFGMLPSADRRRFLTMIRALTASAASA
jgi:transcriptional regulator with XRE-family HTH domain